MIMRNSRNKGFTLVEVVIIVGIIALIILILRPYVSNKIDKLEAEKKPPYQTMYVYMVDQEGHYTHLTTIVNQELHYSSDNRAFYWGEESFFDSNHNVIYIPENMLIFLSKKPLDEELLR